MCRVHFTIERSVVGELVKQLEKPDRNPRPTEAGLCLLHLEQVLRAIGPEHVARQLLSEEAAALQRLAEDMRRTQFSETACAAGYPARKTAALNVEQ
jgi:hypothetical protein